MDSLTANLLMLLCTGLGIAGVIGWWRRHRGIGSVKWLDLERLERDRNEALAALGKLTKCAYEGIYLIDPVQMRYLYANPSGLRALGMDKSVLQNTFVKDVHPEHFGVLLSQVERAVKHQEVVRFSIMARHADGHSFPVQLCCMTVQRENKTLLLALGRDVSRWEESNRRIRKLNRLYAMLSQSNRAIARHKRPDILLNEICDVAVMEGGFRLAWAAAIEGDLLRPITQSGESDELLKNLRVTLDDSPYGRGPTAQSVRTGSVQYHNDMRNDPRFEAWRETINRCGVQSMASIPIMIRGTVEYVVSFYAEPPNYVDTEMASLLQDLGSDLSLGLTRLVIDSERAMAVRQVNQLSQAVEQSADAVMIINMDGEIDYINPRFTEITGYPRGEVVGRRPNFLCSNEEEALKYDGVFEDLKEGRSWKGDFRNQRKSGELYWSHDTISPIRGEAGEITHFISTAEDYTELRKAQDTIEQLAFYDPLTSLPNRRLLLDRISQAIQLAHREQNRMAILFLDLDKFKQVNDSLGHPAGDELLVEISKRLVSAVRSTDTVARLGGDEFTIVLSQVSDVSEVVSIAEVVLETARSPIELEGMSVQASTSIGITLYPDDGAEIAELLRNADLAMYHAKSLGRNTFQFYTEEINRRALGQVEKENRLRRAIEESQFVLHYQPQLCVNSHEVCGMEALVRWNSPDHGLVMPGDFIQFAEETGLIEPIGEWVLAHAMHEMSEFIERFELPVKVAINLSAYQFRRSDRLLNQVRSLIEESRLLPHWVELELTESMLVDNIEETIETLYALRALGVKLAIDDFGTGYSSLNYLKQFPIDVLKIDRTFVHDLESDPSDAAITSAIVAVGHQLGLKVVAEGVENSEQLHFLKDSHCDYYQGYAASKPRPLEELAVMVEDGDMVIKRNIFA